MDEGLDDPRLLGEWFAVAWSREVEPGQLVARKLLGRDIVLWRSSQGIHCWRDLCIHRGAQLSLGRVCGERLVCPYHAWEYNSERTMRAYPFSTRPTAAGQRRALRHTRRGSAMAWSGLALGNHSAIFRSSPYGDDPAFRLILAGPYFFRAKGPRVIENFLDVAHLGFVHAGLLGDPQHGEIEDYEVGMGPHGPEAREIRIWQPDPDGTGKGALVTYHYWACAPLTAGLEKMHGDQRFASWRRSRRSMPAPANRALVMAMDYGHDVPEEDFVRFQDKVTAQDKVVVESQRPELLPLDLQSELHLRSDRMAIAYRKWLREIGFSYGTA